MSQLTTSIGEHLKNKDMPALKKLLNQCELIEILEALPELSPDEKVIVFRLLSKDFALAVFEQLDTGLQHTLLNSFTEERAIETVNEMAPDDRVRLLDELPAKVAKKLLDALSPEEKMQTALLMGYPPQTAGRIMTTEYVRLHKNITVEEALEKLRTQGRDKESFYILYVTDEQRKLQGVISLRELVMADPRARIEEVMQKKVIKVTTQTDQEEVAKVLRELDLLAVPVVDSEDRLVGMITIDDAMDILVDEATDDFFDIAGLADLNRREADRSQALVRGSLFQIWLVRMPFLLITLLGGLLAGGIIHAFEQALQTVAAIAAFIPIIMDMGGNISTQSSTIFARALVMGHLNVKRFARHLLKETAVGLSMGVCVGVIAGVITYLWQGILGLGLAVGLSLVCTMTLGSALGFLIPFLLLKSNVDQVAASNPIITTVKDITGLIIYFIFINLFLGYLL